MRKESEVAVKKLITKNQMDELVKIIICYAAKHGMTIYNLRKVEKEVEKYMRDNAVLDKEDPAKD